MAEHEQQKLTLVGLLKTWLISALGILIASQISIGIRVDGPEPLIVAVLILSLLNTIVRPILVLFALPFVILTLGLGLWVINALLFMLVGGIVDGFSVDSFWWALWGSFVVGVTSLVLGTLLGDRHTGIEVRARGSIRSNRAPRPGSSRNVDAGKKDDDVIDV